MDYHWTNLCCSSISCTEHCCLEECRYWDTRQQNPAHTQQLPERCYAMSVRHPLMVVATADRNIVVYNLANPQTEFKRIMSPLKYQTRCVATFPDKQGFLVGSIEGRVAVQHIDDAQQAKNFTFKCHRDNNDIYAVNAISFHPVHATFATSGSDGAYNFWDKDSKQRLKVCFSQTSEFSLFTLSATIRENLRIYFCLSEE
jgi:mRNA export factor